MMGRSDGVRKIGRLKRKYGSMLFLNGLYLTHKLRHTWPKKEKGHGRALLHRWTMECDEDDD